MNDEFDKGIDRIATASDMFLPFLQMVLDRTTELDALRGLAADSSVQAEIREPPIGAVAHR
jgi:hypothetical protein